MYKNPNDMENDEENSRKPTILWRESKTLTPIYMRPVSIIISAAKKNSCSLLQKPNQASR